MKHGQKTKGKTAQAKPSGKKSSSKTASKSKASLGSKKSGAVKTSGTKTGSPRAAESNGKGRSPDGVNFSNPVVAAAFRRAVKKYPTAFRRLTD